jgi:integral membrane protein
LLRIVAFLEGTSFLFLLLVAMPLKYVYGNPAPVRVTGMVHGVLFLLYVYLLFTVALERGWRKRTFFYGLVASVLPLGPFWFELVYLKGKDEEPAA